MSAVYSGMRRIESRVEKTESERSSEIMDDKNEAKRRGVIAFVRGDDIKRPEGKKKTRAKCRRSWTKKS